MHRGHRHPRLEAGLFLYPACQIVTDPAQHSVAELVGARTLPGVESLQARAFRHDQDAEAATALGALANCLADTGDLDR